MKNDIFKQTPAWVGGFILSIEDREGIMIFNSKNNPISIIRVQGNDFGVGQNIYIENDTYKIYSVIVNSSDFSKDRSNPEDGKYFMQIRIIVSENAPEYEYQTL